MSRTYTISELESLTGIRRRTIHFYTQQGLLPTPTGAGGSARYGEEHILRLKLIREMQTSHLKLSGIREALDAMSIEEMRGIAGKTGGSNITWDSRSIERWVSHTSPDKDTVLVQGSDPGYVVERIEAPETTEEQESFSFLDALDRARSRERIHGTDTLKNQHPGHRRDLPLGDTAQWERIHLRDGIELHVRSDRYHRNQRAIGRLVEFCKKLF